jgi:hypothetical protein
MKKVVHLEYSDGSKKPIEVVTSFVQFYTGAADSLWMISGICSYHLAVWALNKMSKWNTITLNSSARGEFCADIVRNSHKKYADQTVKEAIKELVRCDIMISMSDPGKREALYMMNPNLFWKSSKKGERMETIKAYKYKKEQYEAN